MLFIDGASVSVPAGGTAAFIGCDIAFLIASGLGMPGVGVTPGFRPFFSSSGLGMPGVGVAPFGNTVAFAGIPGVVFAEGGIGFGFNPSGRFAGSILTAALAAILLAAVLVAAEFVLAEPPQAAAAAAIRNSKKSDAIRNIYYDLSLE